MYKEVKIRDKVQIEVHDGGDFDFVDYEQLWATMLNSVHCECGETFYKDENAVEHLIEVGEFDG